MTIIAEEYLDAEAGRGMMLDTMGQPLSLKTEGCRSSTAQPFDLLLKTVAEGSRKRR
jgi:hypothetical protein